MHPDRRKARYHKKYTGCKQIKDHQLLHWTNFLWTFSKRSEAVHLSGLFIRTCNDARGQREREQLGTLLTYIHQLKDMWREKSVAHYVQEVKENGYTVLEGFLSAESVNDMADKFPQYLETRMRSAPDRGPNRFYLTLPFVKPFADQTYFADAYLLEIIEGIVGKDPVMCQLAADTPLKGSDYQTIHRDTEALFFESPTYQETPAFQLALNFPLCDVPDDSWGPLQIAKGTHMMTSYEQNELIAADRVPLDTLYMRKGDAIIRDVRGLHRGTPNSHDEPRPMIVVGYSRRWLRRPEVGVKVPQSLFDELSPQAKHLLRFEPVVSDEEVNTYDGKEKYDADVLTKASGHSITLQQY